jgi:hypothetical protein
MAASSSISSDDVVDLGSADNLDEATSKIFFSDGDATGADLSWPAAAEITSTLTSQSMLDTLCETHGVPKEYRPICANHFGWCACTTPPAGSRTMCVYAAALDAGLRFPLHSFYARVLAHYGLAPSQLSPNAWSYLAAFVLRCKEAGVEPMASAFRYFFSICTKRRNGEHTGWHHFQPFTDGGRRLFTGTLPSKAGWKSRFFFLESPTRLNWNCRGKWGKPKKEGARRVELTNYVIEKLKQMPAIDLKSFLNNHVQHLPVGDYVSLTQLQTRVKAEARGATASGAVAAETESPSTRKRKSPAQALSSPQTVQSFAGSTELSSGMASTGPAAVFRNEGIREPVNMPLPQRSAGFTPDSSLIGGFSNGGRSTEPNPPQLQNLAGSSGSASIRAFIGNGITRETTPVQLQSGLPQIRAFSSNGDNSFTTLPQQQSFPDSRSWPWGLPHGRDVGTEGRSELSSPQHRMCTSDALQLWEAITERDEMLRAANAKAGEHAAKIAKLNEELLLVKAWNVQHQNALANYAAKQVHLSERLNVATHQNNQLKEEHARVEMEYMAEHNQLISHRRLASVEVEQLKSEHAAVVMQLKEEHAAEKALLKEELAAENARLKEELEAEVTQLKMMLVDYNDMGCSPVRTEDQ